MKIKAFVVIDTNILVSAMYTKNSPPFQVLELVENGNLIPIFDKRMLKEYYEVLNRKKFVAKFGKELTELKAREIIYTLVSNGICINDIQKTVQEIKDKSDIPFFEVKESSEEFNSMLVTGNIKHFPEDRYIVTPRVLLATLHQMDFFIHVDIDYEKAIETIIKTNIETLKYTLGDDLLNDIFEDVEEKVINEDFFEESEEKREEE